MNIKLEIFAGAVADVINTTINSAMKNVDVNPDDIVNCLAIIILDEIKSVIQNQELEDDFDVVEKIVRIFEKYNIDAGFRHDFG